MPVWAIYVIFICIFAGIIVIPLILAIKTYNPEEAARAAEKDRQQGL